MDKSSNKNGVKNNAVEISSNNYPERTSKTTTNEKVKIRPIADEKAISNLKSRIPDIDNIFDIHGRIGNGTFSTVLLASLKRHSNIPKEQRKLFAIKHLIPTSHPKRIQKELKCLVEIGGVDNVGGIDLCLRRNESVAFVMPYIAHDSFHDYFNKMNTQEIQKYIKNLLIALKRVHSFNIIHRDVKPSNFLYNRKFGQFMLVDFGLAQSVYGNNDDDMINSNITSISTSTSTTTTTAAREGVKKDDQRDQQIKTTTTSTVKIDDDNNIMQKNHRKRKAIDIDISKDDDYHHSIMNCSTKKIKKEDEIMTENQYKKNSIKTSPNLNSPNSSPFKMPLKQVNEITTASKHNNNNLLKNSKLNSPLSQHVKSAILGVTMTSRLEEKLRDIKSPLQHHRNTSNNNNNIRRQPNNNSPSIIKSTSATTTATTASTRPSTTRKYNTNNRLSTSYQQDTKCYCYGKNQVCNICIIKKEIPASRAGTPGYRPPEVLLKYIEQTTSVDIWAVGVILISILSGVYPFFQAPDDFLALAEIVTIFGDDIIRRTALQLGRQITMSRKCQPLDLRKLCIRLRNRFKLDRTEAVKKYQQKQKQQQQQYQHKNDNGNNNNNNNNLLECTNCQQKSFDCLCLNSPFQTEPIGDDEFPSSLYNLLERLLEVNPYKRITAEEALNHQFFKEIYS